MVVVVVILAGVEEPFAGELAGREGILEEALRLAVDEQERKEEDCLGKHGTDCH